MAGMRQAGSDATSARERECAAVDGEPNQYLVQSGVDVSIARWGGCIALPSRTMRTAGVHHDSPPAVASASGGVPAAAPAGTAARRATPRPGRGRRSRRQNGAPAGTAARRATPRPGRGWRGRRQNGTPTRRCCPTRSSSTETATGVWRKTRAIRAWCSTETAWTRPRRTPRDEAGKPGTSVYTHCRAVSVTAAISSNICSTGTPSSRASSLRRTASSVIKWCRRSVSSRVRRGRSSPPPV